MSILHSAKGLENIPFFPRQEYRKSEDNNAEHLHFVNIILIHFTVNRIPPKTNEKQDLNASVKSLDFVLGQAFQ